MIQILGLAGGMKRGKDTTARILKRFGYLTLGFGELVRQEIEYLKRLGIFPDRLPEDIKRDMLECPTHELWAEDKTDRSRRIQQAWGSYRRSEDQDYFIRLIHGQLDPEKKYAITGVRYRNEYDLIKRLDGQVWSIERDVNADGIPNHESEKLDFPVDLMIDNSGTLKQLEQHVYAALNVQLS